MQLFNTVFGRGLVASIPQIITGPYLVVTMPDIWPMFEAELGGTGEPYFVTTLERTELNAAVDSHAGFSAVVGLGGGQAIDAAKLFAAPRNVPLFQIPTAMSVNAPFGHRAAVRIDGNIKYVGWAVPEAVFVDYDIIEGAPADLNRAGAGDILCYHTALWDWQVAQETGNVERNWPYDPYWADQARDTLNSVIDAADEIHDCSELGIRTLMSGHQWGGAAFANAGWNPRPIEGAEHFFFYSLEYETNQHFIHGQPVGLGLLLMSMLQDNDPQRIKDVCDRIGIKYRPSDMGVTWDDVTRALFNMKDYVDRNDLWYTVASEREITQEFIDAAHDWIEA